MEDFGGSAKIARELFNMLQPRHDDYVTQEEMTERLDDVLKLYLKQKDEDMSGKVVFFLICLFCFFLCNRLTNVSLYNQGTLVWITKGISVEGVRLCHRRQLVLLEHSFPKRLRCQGGSDS